MTKDKILQSINLKKRFVKDNNLPITVFHDPYFSERLQTIDRLFGCVKDFELFCVELQAFENEEQYFEEYNRTKDTVINFIKAKPQFEQFINDKFNSPPSFPKNNLYSVENVGKSFISIDMRKANFTAMNLYSSGIFDGETTWESFMSKFTNIQHIIHSKYIRQVILGACNPKKQIQFELYLMGRLLTWIINQVPEVDVFSLTNDEIILYHPNQSDRIANNEQEQKIVDNIRDALNRHVIGHKCRMEEFYLDELYDGRFQKVDMNDLSKVVFKCVDAELFHQYTKRYFAEEITENDLVFYHNGILAKFLEPIPDFLNPIANS